MAVATAIKTAVVTGGASGMGRIITKRLAAQGVDVVAMDLNEQGLQETAEASDKIKTVVCNVADGDSVTAAFSQTKQLLGDIDRLVHAAAIMPSHQIKDHAPQDLARLTNIVYGGTVNVVHAVLPDMLARNSGDIIVFGSVAGYAIVPKMGGYSAAKAATNAWTEALIHELRDTALNIHLVCPPAVNTPLVDQTIATDTPAAILEAKKSGRLADPEKIVDAIDKGVAKGKKIIYPGEARFLKFWHDLAPGLWWKTVMSFESK